MTTETDTPSTGSSHLVSADELSAALNIAADDILDIAECGDQGVRDALNLLVNAIPVYLDNGWHDHDLDPTTARDRLQHVVDGNYDADLDEILDWINAG